MLKPFLIVIGALFPFVLFAYQDELSGSDPFLDRPAASLNEQLLDLPPNKWVKLRVPFAGGWRRQRHAGIAFDTHRNKLFVFGSDTHGENWDNSVHEFDPVILQWSAHYPPARRRTYGADALGHPVAGIDFSQPWAMHVYDNLVYDPTLDALLVMASPEHNPAMKTVRGIRRNPTWVYELGPRRWRTLDNPDGKQPFGFAGASSYDSARDVVVTYSEKGVWELGPDRKGWIQATPESHHHMYQSMEYDSRHAKLAVFGGDKGGNRVWVYTPGRVAGEKGSWEEECHVVITAQRIAISRWPSTAILGCSCWCRATLCPKVQRSPSPVVPVSMIWEAIPNIRLPNAEMPALGMNYTMAYDPSNKVFFLVTGDWKRPPAVWALHLELFPFEKRLMPDA